MLKEKVFLTQTDTTIGFVSQDADKLTRIKQRPPHKRYIKAINSLRTLQTLTRIPSIHKNIVRRSIKTTFIMPKGDSYRVICDRHHLLLLNRLKWCYTTSANPSGKSFDGVFAKEQAEIAITPLKTTAQPSKIYRLGKKNLHRIR